MHFGINLVHKWTMNSNGFTRLTKALTWEVLCHFHPYNIFSKSLCESYIKVAKIPKLLVFISKFETNGVPKVETTIMISKCNQMGECDTIFCNLWNNLSNVYPIVNIVLKYWFGHDFPLNYILNAWDIWKHLKHFCLDFLNDHNF